MHRLLRSLAAVAAMAVCTIGGVSSAAAQATGSIAGTVTDSQSGTPLVSIQPYPFVAALSNASGAAVAEIATDSGGHYTFTSLPAGTYYVNVRHRGGYIGELYGDIPCISGDCVVTSGTPVVVAAGASVTGIDFALTLGGSISGTVRRASTGLGFATSVGIYTSSGRLITWLASAADGTFRLDGLPTGPYYAFASGAIGDVQSTFGQLYGGTFCLSFATCRILSAVPIQVVAGVVTSGIDFSLLSPGSIAGSFRGSDGSLVSGTVTVVSGPASKTGLAQAGQFTISGLAPGRYYVRGNSDGNAQVDYPSVVTVTSGATTSGVDLVVSQQGSISGTIRWEPGPASAIVGWLDGGGGSLALYDAAGVFVRTVPISTSLPLAPAQYVVTGLPAGSYYLRYEVQAGGFSSATFYSNLGDLVEYTYGGTPCVTIDCDVRAGTPITVAAGGSVTGIDFDLHRGSVIREVPPGSTVFDARGVRLSPRRYRTLSSVFGTGYEVAGLPPGTYYVRLPGGRLYQDVACADCPATSGTPIVLPSSSPISVGDATGPRAISGVVRAAVGGAALSTITVMAFNEAGLPVGAATSDMVGKYRIAGLVSGTYYLQTTNDNGWVDQAYGGVTCVSCDPRTATPVTVSAADVSSIDFALAAASVIAGTVTDTNGVGFSGVPIAVFDATGGFVGRRSSNAAGRYAIEVPAGTYYARTEPVSGRTSSLFNTVACATAACDPLTGTPITTGTPQSLAVDFSLAACQAMTVTPPLLASAVEGRPYRQVFFTTGAAGGVRYSVIDGQLPLGVTLDAATGVLAGTPATSGTHEFTVAVRDGAGCGTTSVRALNVAQCAFALSTTSASVGAAGGVVTVPVYDACGAAALASQASWLQVAGTVVGAPGQISVTVAATTSGAARTGTVSIGPRVFTVRQAGLASTEPIGVLDTPTDGTQVIGSIAITGWALDDVEVARVRILRDPVAGEAPGQPVFIGNAVFVAGARPDVERLYGSLPFANRAGWGYLLLSNMLPSGGNGPFRIHAFADDAEGHATLIGSRLIIGINNSAAAPFGAIDTPAQGDVIGGTSYLNWGWALTPQPRSIPTDGSTIRVYVDGVALGTVTYNLFRADIAALFPGLANTPGPVGYRALDTTTLAEGVHTIAWVATDGGGASTGIGSRYFTVRNSVDGVVPAALVSEPGSAAPLALSMPAGPDAGRRASGLLASGDDDVREVSLGSLESIELRLGTTDTACDASHAGYLEVDGELRPLPAGAAVDPAGVFYWQPGPAFTGDYRILIVRTDCTGQQSKTVIKVRVG